NDHRIALACPAVPVSSGRRHAMNQYLLYRHCRGVTLMEVLATLLLVAIVLPVALEGVTISMQAAARARPQTEAAALAEMKLNEILAARSTSLLSGSGDFGVDYPDYRWEITAVSQDLNLYEVTVIIRWTERGMERSYQLSSLVYPDN